MSSKIKELEAIAAVAFALEVESLSLGDSAETVENWDSLGQLSILAKLGEITDGATDDIEELATANSVGEVIQLLRNKGLLI